MDEVDVRIAQLLMRNSRTPYRVLADHLNISLQAVHSRIQSLTKAGIIRGFTATLSPSYLGAIGIDVVGAANLSRSEEWVRTLGRNEFVVDVFLGAGGSVFIRGLLRKPSDLERLLEFMRTTGHLTDIWVGLQSFGLAGRQRMDDDAESGKITTIDFRILNALRADSRKPISEIADQVGVSTKTVARRLNRMIEDRMITLPIKWFPGMASGVVTYLQIRLKQGADKIPTAAALADKYSPRIVFLGSYSNFPDLLGAIAWTPTPVAQNELTMELTKEQSVVRVTPYVLLKKYEFDTWADNMITEGALGRGGVKSED